MPTLYHSINDVIGTKCVVSFVSFQIR